MASPHCTLINGAKMPLFGFGTWLSQPNVVGESVKNALKIGYRHIDCAHVYGNEGEVGAAFTSFFSSGGVKREDVFVTSKLWTSDFGNVRDACKRSLEKLRLDYLDLYLIHLPFEVDGSIFAFPPTPKGNGVIGYKPERIAHVWKEMESLVKDGMVKAIGVSNFTVEKIRNLLKSPLDVKIACNQVELHPYCPQHSLVEFCNQNDIKIVAFGPLGNPGNPEHKADEDNLLTDAVVKKIADKHKVTPAKVLICYGLERKFGVLVKSVNTGRIKENLESLDVKLDTDDMAALNAIETRRRFCRQLWSRKPDEEEEDLWDGEFKG